MTRAARTKLPESPGRRLSRPRLEHLVERAVERRLTTVVADAGFGKTTLLGSWAGRIPSAWYALDRDDTAVSDLASGIVLALSDHLPGAVPELAAMVGGLPGTASEEPARAEAVASALCETIEHHLEAEMLLVLDDLQEVGADGPAIRLIEAVVRHAPPRLHVVLVGRDPPAFPIDRLRGQGQLLELTGAEMAFTLDEVGALLEAWLDRSARQLAPQLLAMSGGWPAAVGLAIEALDRTPADARTAALDALRATDGPLIDYLAHEVFARQPQGVRELVRRVAILERFNAELCAAVGVDDAPELLADLSRRGLFVQPLGDGWMTLPELIRRYAIDRLALPQRDARAIQRRAAAWFVSRGSLGEAATRLLASGDARAIQRFLVEHGSDALAAGAIREVVRAGDALASTDLDDGLDEVLGEASLLNGDMDRALARFERSAGGAERLSAGLAWRIGLLRYLRGELPEALEAFRRGRIDREPPHDATLLLAWTATACWLMGQIDEARSLASRGHELATATGDDRGLAAAHTVLAMLASLDGDGPAVEAHSEAALDAATRATDVLQTVRIRTNRASHRADEGRNAEALADLDEAIRRAEVTGYAFFHALALSNRGQVRTTLGQLEAAMVDLEASRAIYRRIGSRSAHYAVLGMAHLHLLRGDLVAARAAYEEVLSAAELSGDLQTMTPALAGLARIVAHEDPQRARDLAERAVATGPRPTHVNALLSAGWVALAHTDRATARSMAAAASAEAGRRHDPPGLAEAIELAAAIDPDGSGDALFEALAVWQRTNDPIGTARVSLALARRSGRPEDRVRAATAERTLAALGVRLDAASAAAGPLAHVLGPRAAAVSIRTLGSFAVIRDGEPVALSEWQSRKARDLVKILIARRGRATVREALMEALWPGEDPDRSSNRLSVALATARAVLDPDKRHPPDHFLAADGESVRLVPSSVSLDIERFLADAAAGLHRLRAGRPDEAMPFLVAAEAAYAGDFLEESPYEDWAAPLRDEARAASIDVARALADEARRTGDHASVVRYELRILERDPYDEEAHLRLIGALAAVGRHGEARRHYRAYGERMREIEVEAVPYSFR